MDILQKWLNNEVRLSEKITNLETQFANGYLLGELLSKYNQIIEFEDQFINNSAKSAVVRNYSQVFSILQTMRVNFDSNSALSIINKEPGIVVLLLRSLKNHLEKTKGIVDYRIKQKTGSPNIVFPLKQFETKKENFEKIKLRLFTERLEAMIPSQKVSELEKKMVVFEQFKQTTDLENKKLDEIDKQQAENEKALFHNKLQETLKKSMKFKENWSIEGETKWKDNIKIFKDRQKQEEQFCQTRKNREERNKIKNQEKDMLLVNVEIAEFESKNLSKPELLESESYPLDQNFGLTSKAIQAKLISEICTTIDIKHIKEQIKTREKVTHSEMNRKEKDRRLRKMIVDFKKWQAVKDVHLLKTKIMADVLQESRQEEEIRYEFFKVKEYEDIFMENKKLRDQMCSQSNQQISQLYTIGNQKKFQSLVQDYNQSVRFAIEEERKVDVRSNLEKYDFKYRTCKRVLDMFIDVSVNIFKFCNQVNSQNQLENRLFGDFQKLRMKSLTFDKKTTDFSFNTENVIFQSKLNKFDDCLFKDYLTFARLLIRKLAIEHQSKRQRGDYKKRTWY